MTEQDQLERTTTGIPGCDRILCGGFVVGGVYMIQGAPGTGKTTFGNQVAYHHVRTGQRALYFTMLAEAHARMLVHLRTMSFFDPAALPEHLVYYSGFKQLEEHGLRGLLELVRKELRGRRASFLVLDGLVSARESASSSRDLKKFVQELQTLASFHDCTMLLLTSDMSTAGAEHTMVDGLLDLQVEAFGRAWERTMSVRKSRGSDSMAGRHSFEITNQGITTYPRIEAICGDLPDVVPGDRISTGVAGLDSLLGGGGLAIGTTTMLLGAPGTGRTTVGLTFAAQSTEAAPGLILSFRDSPSWLTAKARSVGLDLEVKCRAGALTILWHPAVEAHADKLGARLLERIRSRAIQRLFIDGMDVLQTTLEDQKRHHFITALAHLLRGAGVATVFETEPAEGSTIFEREVPPVRSLPLSDNILSLRMVRVRSQIHRILAVQKLKDAGFDSCARAFRITSQGIQIDDTSHDAEAILTAHAQQGNASLSLPSIPDDWRGHAAEKRETVLIVDDEPILAEVLAAALGDAGFRPVVAFDGEQGLTRLSEQHVDLILLDYMMPVLDGPGMLHKARADPRWQQLPVILMSGLDKARVVGAYTVYVRKPFSLRTLLDTIAKVLPS